MKKTHHSIAALSVLICMTIVVNAGDSTGPVLVAYWPMDEGSGTTVHDATGRGHNGTIQGSSTEWDWVQGVHGSALYFHGGQNAYYPYIFIPGHSDFKFSTGSFTLEAWAKLDGSINTAYGEVIIGTNWGPERAITLGFGIPPIPSFFPRSHGESNAVMGPNEANLSRWYFLVGVRNAEEDKVQLYVDGVLVDEKEDESSTFTSGHPWSISGQFTWIWKAMGCFHGVLDEVSVYKCALSAEEIQDRYFQYAPHIELKPNVCNKHSKGKWITCYIEHPFEYGVDEIDITTLQIDQIDGAALTDPIPAESRPIKIGDHDADGIEDLMVKFKRLSVIEEIGEKEGNVELTVSGEVSDILFKASDQVFFMSPGQLHKSQEGLASDISSFFFELSYNYPNPFNASTMINFSIPNPALVSLKIYDLHGRFIDTLLEEHRQAGDYQVQWNPQNLPSGIYLYRLEAGEYVETRKMLFIE